MPTSKPTFTIRRKNPELDRHFENADSMAAWLDDVDTDRVSVPLPSREVRSMITTLLAEKAKVVYQRGAELSPDREIKEVTLECSNGVNVPLHVFTQPVNGKQVVYPEIVGAGEGTIENFRPKQPTRKYREAMALALLGERKSRFAQTNITFGSSVMGCDHRKRRNF